MNFAEYSFDPVHLPPPSSDDDHDAGPSNAKNIKRGTRACDRCRKLKSKCEPTQGDKCKNCAAAAAPCTFQGPSFKRGPPKGYIHAIEQRWHQVECILGAIMASSQAQTVVGELRSDPLARAILDRVDSGPYGPRGRARQPPQGATPDNFYATIMGTDHASRDDRRARRQSRMTRETVSIEDATMLAAPTKEWQDSLIRRLNGTVMSDYTSVSMSTPITSSASHSSSSHYEQGQGQQEPRRRRRLEGTYVPDSVLAQSNWDEQYSMSGDPNANWDEVDDTVDSFGHLALDDHKEIRYHGHASGLPLLARSERQEGDREGHGIWKFPPLKEEPVSESIDLSADDDTNVHLPPLDLQRHLIDLYFTYVHPFFPVINKWYFLDNYPPHSPPSASPEAIGAPADSAQKINKLLLLVMFSLADRYSNLRPNDGNKWNSGMLYAIHARQILNRTFQYSRPATVQALLLLGIREFGLGAMEQGWLYSGMALRMAIDLGMNRNADNWTDNGKDLFSPVEKQIRKQIWWSCCITDKLSAMWMGEAFLQGGPWKWPSESFSDLTPLGRPITFRANDYTTLKPEVPPEDEYDNWQPCPPDALGPDFQPRPSMIMSCFREQCELSVVITYIMDQIYPVKSLNDTSRRTLLQQLEARLHSWLFSLPEHLRYSTTGSLSIPLPHILILHVEYCAAVLLLHRAFIPHANGRSDDNGEGNPQSDPLPLKSFDICQSAASHISSIVTIYDEKYGLSTAPPFLSIYLQSAGIMHVITLSRRPQNPQATIGLKQCITALEKLETVWPSASRVRILLEGVKVRKGQMAQATQNQQNQQPLRHKRSAEEALGAERNSDVLRRESSDRHATYAEPGAAQAATGHDEHINQHLMLHTLGLDLQGIQASTSFYPGYQWWPHQNFDEAVMQNHMMDIATADTSTSMLSNPTIPEASFMFDQQQLNSEFVQGVHYPILDPSHLFPSNPHPYPPQHDPGS